MKNLANVRHWIALIASILVTLGISLLFSALINFFEIDHLIRPKDIPVFFAGICVFALLYLTSESEGKQTVKFFLKLYLVGACVAQVLLLIQRL